MAQRGEKKPVSRTREYFLFLCDDDDDDSSSSEYTSLGISSERVARRKVMVNSFAFPGRDPPVE